MNVFSTYFEDPRLPVVNLLFLIPRFIVIIKAIVELNFFLNLADLCFVAIELSFNIQNNEFSSYVIGFAVVEIIVFLVLLYKGLSA